MNQIQFSCLGWQKAVKQQGNMNVMRVQTTVYQEGSRVHSFKSGFFLDFSIPICNLYDIYLFLLPYPVSTSHCLEIILRVPITVEDNHRVCSCQVYTQPSSPCTEQKAEVWTTISIEMVQSLCSDLPLYTWSISLWLTQISIGTD